MADLMNWTKEQLVKRIQELQLQLSGDTNARDLCGNCGHWREEHYHRITGAWVGERFGCTDYQGVEAPAERRQDKFEEVETSRATPVPT